MKAVRLWSIRNAGWLKNTMRRSKARSNALGRREPWRPAA